MLKLRYGSKNRKVAVNKNNRSSLKIVNGSELFESFYLLNYRVKNK